MGLYSFIWLYKNILFQKKKTKNICRHIVWAGAHLNSIVFCLFLHFFKRFLHVGFVPYYYCCVLGFILQLISHWGQRKMLQVCHFLTLWCNFKIPFMVWVMTFIYRKQFNTKLWDFTVFVNCLHNRKVKNKQTKNKKTPLVPNAWQWWYSDVSDKCFCGGIKDQQQEIQMRSLTLKQH